MKTVKIDNKTWLQFPDDMSQEEIDRRVKRYVDDRKFQGERIRDSFKCGSKAVIVDDKTIERNERRRIAALNQYRFATNVKIR